MYLKSEIIQQRKVAISDLKTMVDLRRKFMKNVVNLTPHEVTVLVGENKISFASRGIARVTQKNTPSGELEGGIPLYRAEFGAVEGLPQPNDDTMYIVSSIVRAACPDRQDLLVPTDFIRSPEGQIIGCRGFLR